MASETTGPAPQGENGKTSTFDAISVPPIAREILENYSSIPPDEVAPHVLRIVCRLRSACYQLPQHVHPSQPSLSKAGAITSRGETSMLTYPWI